LLDRARAKTKSILFLRSSILSFPTSTAPPAPFLFSCYPNCRLRLHFIHNPLRLAPTRSFLAPTSLAPPLSFTRPIRAQTTRLRLRHLNKPRLRTLRSRPEGPCFLCAPCCLRFLLRIMCSLKGLQWYSDSGRSRAPTSSLKGSFGYASLYRGVLAIKVCSFPCSYFGPTRFAPTSLTTSLRFTIPPLP
jgi:hypothetical protein